MTLEQLGGGLGFIGSFQMSVTSFLQLFDIQTETENPRDLTFNNDGTKMFIIAGDFDSVFQYSLRRGLDLGTASFTGTSFDISGQEDISESLDFSNNGKTMFVMGSGSDSVHQYSLTTAFDLNSASFDNTSFDISSEDGFPRGIEFNSDGTKMFMTGRASQSVFQYSLTTGFDISTASYTNTSFNVSSQANAPRGLVFSPDGTSMFVTGSDSNSVHQYSLTDGFNLSTASFTGKSFNVEAQLDVPGQIQDVTFSQDGTSMFTIGNNSDSVHQTLVGEPGPI